jgi:hypothetical protein
LDLLTPSPIHKQYSAIADLHAFQFTVAHALGFPVSTSRCLVADLNIGTITSNHYEVFLPFLLQSPWTVDPILQFYLYTVVFPFPWFLTPYYSMLQTPVIQTRHGAQRKHSTVVSRGPYTKHLLLPELLYYLATSCNIRPQRTQLPLLRVGMCLPSRCLAML